MYHSHMYTVTGAFVLEILVLQTEIFAGPKCPLQGSYVIEDVWMEKKCLPIHDLPLRTKFFVTALALYWSVKQYQSELIMLDGPLSSQEQRTSGWHLSWDMVGNNSPSTYHSHSVRILGVCPFSHAVHFFPCGWVPNTFENMVASNTAILNFSELAYATR